MTQTGRIVAALRDAGALGHTTATLQSELAPDSKTGFKGCSKYTGRISDARRKGWDIRGYQIPGSPQFRYFFFGGNGEACKRTEEECRKATDRLALKRVWKMTWLEGPTFSLGEKVLA